MDRTYHLMPPTLSDQDSLRPVVQRTKQQQRDRSLNAELVTHITSLRHLRSLELSGHARFYFDPRMIGRMESLQDLRFMMPDQTIKDSLLTIVEALSQRKRGGLRGLGLICRVGCAVSHIRLHRDVQLMISVFSPDR
jgi:hypothetical protein